MTFTVRPLGADDVSACAALLDDLSEWFGLAESNPGSTEIHVMAVRRDLHRLGVGRRLVGASIDHATVAGARWLHVKTRGPSTYDDDYEKTRRFYLSVGFEPLYESSTEWGAEDAALVLVMRLGDR